MFPSLPRSGGGGAQGRRKELASLPWREVAFEGKTVGSQWSQAQNFPRRTAGSCREEEVAKQAVEEARRVAREASRVRRALEMAASPRQGDLSLPQHKCVCPQYSCDFERDESRVPRQLG